MPTLLGVTEARRKHVRRLAGNLDDSDIDNADLDEIIEEWDDWVKVQTNKFDWVATDQKFKQVLNASDLMSSAEILDGIPTELAAKKAGDQRVAARDIVKGINRKDEEIQNNAAGEIIVGETNVTDELDPLNYIPDATTT